MKVGLYTNRVTWSIYESHGRSTSIYYNGNHCFNNMHYHSDVYAETIIIQDGIGWYNLLTLVSKELHRHNLVPDCAYGVIVY